MPQPCYIQVILPLRLGWEPFYIAGPDTHPGQRVRVEFARKEYIGVVHTTDVTPDMEGSRVRRIKGPAEGYEDISLQEIKLWEFAAEYYLCTIGEVYKNAYPMQKLVAEGVDAREAERLLARIERIDGEIERRSMSKRASREVTDRMIAERARLSAEREMLLARDSSLIGTVQETYRQSETQKTAPKHGKPRLYNFGNREDKYIDAIRKTLEEGRSALILTPDIIFCEKLEDSLAPAFPQLQTYTSKKTAAARRRIAESVRSGSALILGTRSSIFLPFKDLGLIIIDNEQDNSYKQEEPAPRYNGRDLAVVLAGIHGAEVIFGTSTPSLETILNCRSGKYLSDVNPTRKEKKSVQIIDIPAEKRKNGMVGIFSRKLIEEITSVPGRIALIRGWEKPEEIREQSDRLFPSREITVMTLAEARRSTLKEYDLTAVLQADAFMSKEDFRSDERLLHTLESLSELCSGHLFIQSSNASHRVYQSICSQNASFIDEMLVERKDFGLPPFTRLVDIIFNDENEARYKKLSAELIKVLRKNYEVSGMMNRRIRLSFPRDAMLSERKAALMRAVNEFSESHRYGQHIHLDVDPD